MSFVWCRNVAPPKATSQGGSEISPLADDGKVHCVMVIDESGSMMDNKNATLTSVNNFISAQADAKTDESGNPLPPLYLTVVTFDNVNQTVVDRVCLGGGVTSSSSQNFSEYHPEKGGSTALFDAIGDTIKRYSLLTHVMMVIVTDGEENASTKYNRASINLLITEQRQRGWEFKFLGANQDAWKTGNSMGLGVHQCEGFEASPAGVTQMYNRVSSDVNAYRSSQKM